MRERLLSGQETTNIDSSLPSPSVYYPFDNSLVDVNGVNTASYNIAGSAFSDNFDDGIQNAVWTKTTESTMTLT